ncbi:MAG TPA: transporter substrate-binding domain-containing protein [Fluviicola sp.]|nr:transporter substrate-binding domain-containing protein [Fluviicola sp.]
MTSHKAYIKICFSLVLAGVFLLQTSCGSDDEDARKRPLATTDNDLPGILKKGKLRVLAENSSTSYFIYKGKRMGFEYELLREFAEDLGVELEVITVNDLNEITTRLNNDEGDLIACNYAVTRDRQDVINFSRPFYQTNQVLIQRKQDTTKETSDEAWKKYHVSDPLQLANKKVDVWKNSSYYDRLINLQDEIGATIHIRPTQGNQSVEELIEMVSDGTIDYTVAERNIAQINEKFYDNLDVSLAISFKQNIAFGLRKDAPLLKKRLDAWLTKFMKKEAFRFIKRKYFDPYKQPAGTTTYATAKGGLSPFDNIMKAEAAKYGFDWRLLAAIIYHESKFNPNARAFGGAYGMMQFMPGTGPKFGVYPSSSPEVQIRGGMKYIHKIDQMWKDIADPMERNKFILASYNAGAGHIKDAQKLAAKRGLNPKVWEDNVEKMVMNLGKREYYSDPVVSSGALRGNITYKYVRGIMARYASYKSVF